MFITEAEALAATWPSDIIQLGGSPQDAELEALCEQDECEDSAVFGESRFGPAPVGVLREQSDASTGGGPPSGSTSTHGVLAALARETMQHLDPLELAKMIIIRRLKQYLPHHAGEFVLFADLLQREVQWPSVTSLPSLRHVPDPLCRRVARCGIASAAAGPTAAVWRDQRATRGSAGRRGDPHRRRDCDRCASPRRAGTITHTHAHRVEQRGRAGGWHGQCSDESNGRRRHRRVTAAAPARATHVLSLQRGAACPPGALRPCQGHRSPPPHHTARQQGCGPAGAAWRSAALIVTCADRSAHQFGRWQFEVTVVRFEAAHSSLAVGWDVPRSQWLPTATKTAPFERQAMSPSRDEHTSSPRAAQPEEHVIPGLTPSDIQPRAGTSIAVTADAAAAVAVTDAPGTRMRLHVAERRAVAGSTGRESPARRQRLARGRDGAELCRLQQQCVRLRCQCWGRPS